MTRVFLAMVTIVAIMATGATATAQTPAKPVPATPENAASFLGEWTVAVTGSYGDATLTVTLKTAEGKVVGTVADTNGQHEISDMSRSGASLVVVYYFDYQGMPLDGVVTLTPADKKVDAVVQFAQGAAEFTGTATRK